MASTSQWRKDCQSATSLKESKQCGPLGKHLYLFNGDFENESTWGLGLETWQPKGPDRSSVHKDFACSFHATFCLGHLHGLRFTVSLAPRSMQKLSGQGKRSGAVSLFYLSPHMVRSSQEKAGAVIRCIIAALVYKKFLELRNWFSFKKSWFASTKYTIKKNPDN